MASLFPCCDVYTVFALSNATEGGTVRVAGYVRVSTRQQVEGDSIEAQEEAIREWASSHGHQVVGVYADNGKSGTLDDVDRPGLLDALNEVEQGNADALVVHRLDRLARALHVQEAVLARIWTAEADVWEVVEDRRVLRDDPDDPYRRFVRQVTGAARELERNMIVARMQGGRRRKAGRNGYVGGFVRYGFERRGTGKAAALVPVPAEQAVVKKIVRLHRRGHSLRVIAAKLNAAGVPAKGGGEWAHTTVNRIVKRAA